MTNISTKNVTIVVPVYGDWPSLKKCIESLVQCVEMRHTVMLVNDCGPDVEMLEKNIKKAIKGQSNFKYFRNESNLGFVGTCNKAVSLDKTKNDILLLNSDTMVTEGFLDEMLKVLYMTYKHGAVCPRSNNATIASVPFIFKDGDIDKERHVEYTKKVYSRVKDYLPEYTLAPVAHGFCILIKRFLIEDFGLFDPVYGLGYNEENDFCMRINQYGFSSLIANKALVFHLESKSFASEKKRFLQEENHKTLTKRYPHYDAIVADYLRYGMDPIDRFADIIATDENAPKKILINFYHLPLSMNGTARNCLSFLKMISESDLVMEGKIVPVLLASEESVRFHNLDTYGIRIIAPHEVNELFHVAVCPLQIFHSDNLQLMNRSCLKIVYANLDIIAIRTNHLLYKSFINRVIFQDSLRLVNKIIMISEFTEEDTLAYYPQDAEVIKAKSQVILQGYPDVEFSIDDIDMDHSKNNQIDAFIKNKDYILVFGNDFKHKMLHEAVAVMSKLDARMVVIGPSKLHVSNENILLVESGGISDKVLQKIYSQARLVVFPSLYEGFGLPIAEAARFRKCVIAADYALNREVAQLYGAYSEIYLFKSLNELPKLIEKLLPLQPDGHKTVEVASSDPEFRTITDYNKGILEAVYETAQEPLDVDNLRQRWDYLSRVDQYMIYAGYGKGEHTKSFVERSANFLKSRNQKAYLFARSIYRNTLKKT